eukprot:CAMPEP_0179862136 /NCGR_PEP_ID=MMETSP0982-20121206/14669_1 /TAXON_ID=483367 /ORGANISM="non described non described, Strain CCMP 2436" /LENGTH=123 /DNA_ID=CAMNT_0021749795 /DNA_START=577 /DNA_END=947 /DNA_ORIENTATION=-
MQVKATTGSLSAFPAWPPPRGLCKSAFACSSRAVWCAGFAFPPILSETDNREGGTTAGEVTGAEARASTNTASVELSFAGTSSSGLPAIFSCSLYAPAGKAVTRSKPAAANSACSTLSSSQSS